MQWIRCVFVLSASRVISLGRRHYEAEVIVAGSDEEEEEEEVAPEEEVKGWDVYSIPP